MSIYKLINRFAKYTPSIIKEAVRKRFPVTSYHIYLNQIEDPFSQEPPVWMGDKPRPLIGIVKEFAHYHKHFVQACREMGISYQITDISCDDWISTVERTSCDAYLVWPSSMLSIWKGMFDDRLLIMEREMKKLIYPSYNEIWLYENKRRVNYWLQVNRIPHPCTHIFYNQKDAEEFIRTAQLPIVLKTNTGASANGVFILRNRGEAVRMIRLAFTKGVLARRKHPLDRDWGYVFLQEYIPIVKEWRMVRIGDAYFGHPKGRMGDFHSGSGLVEWDVPPERLLNFVRDITEKGKFTSMDVDVFETEDGRYLVNELQTVFGASYSVDQLRVNGKPGRFVWKDYSGWVFEEGDFARNACANARLEYVITKLCSK